MRIDDEKAREYYLEESQREGWSVRTLERNIKSGYYQRLLSSRLSTNKLPNKKADNSLSYIKDPYVLEFLGLTEDLSGKESLLEGSLVENMQKFLLELGRGFSFAAR